MKMKKIIWMLVFSSLFVFGSVIGQVDIKIESAVNGEANGEIVISVVGDAGHFILTLSGASLSENKQDTLGRNGGTKKYEDLLPGQYTVAVADITGCVEYFTIEIPDESLECHIDLTLRDYQNVQTVSDCDGEVFPKDGRLSIDVDLNIYDVTWKYGTNDISPTDRLNLENLDEGEYTVTVEHKERPDICSASAKFEIFVCTHRRPEGNDCESDNLDQSFRDALNGIFSPPIVTGSSDGDASGSIFWDFSLANSPGPIISTVKFEYYWERESDGQRFYGTSVTGLQPGRYCFKFSDGCGFFDESIFDDPYAFGFDPHGPGGALRFDYFKGCVTIGDCSKLEGLFDLFSTSQNNVLIEAQDHSSFIELRQNSNCLIQNLSYRFTDVNSELGFKDGVTLIISDPSGVRVIHHVQPADFLPNGGGDPESGSYGTIEIPELVPGSGSISIETSAGCREKFDIELPRQEGIVFYTEPVTIYHELNPNGNDGRAETGRATNDPNDPPLFYSLAFGAFVCDDPCPETCSNWEYKEFEYEPDDWDTPCKGGTIKWVQFNGEDYFIKEEVTDAQLSALHASATLFNLEPKTLAGCNNSVTCIFEYVDPDLALVNPDRVTVTVCRDHLKPDNLPNDPIDDCSFDPVLDVVAFVSDDNPCRIMIEVTSNCEISAELRVSDNIGSDWTRSSGEINLEVGLNTYIAIIGSSQNNAEITFEVEIDGQIWSATINPGFGCLNSVTGSEELARINLKNEIKVHPFIAKEVFHSLTESITYFPNPFTQDITIRIQALENKELNILITDLVGKKVYQQDIAVEPGVNDVVVKDMRHVAEGVYLVTVANKDMELVESFKIIKAR